MPWEDVLISRSHLIKLLVGLAVTAICLYAAFRGMDLKDMSSRLRGADYSTLPIFLFLLFVFFWLKAIRWQLLLQPIRKFRTREVVPAMMIGFMGNNVLPAHLGEFVRMYLFARDHKLSRSAVLSSLVLERIFDVLAILVFLGVSLMLMPKPPEEFARYLPGTIAIVGALIAVVIVYIFWTRAFVRFVEWWLARLPFLPRSIKQKLAGMLEEGAAGLASMRSPSLVVGVVVTSAVQWLLVGGFVHLSLRSFGVQESLLAAFVVVAGIAVAVTLPSSPGFFGVVQLAFQMSLAPFGIAREPATAASIYFQIVQYIPVTLVGLYFLNRSGLKLGQLDEQAAREEERVDEELVQASPPMSENDHS